MQMLRVCGDNFGGFFPFVLFMDHIHGQKQTNISQRQNDQLIKSETEPIKVQGLAEKNFRGYRLRG